MKKFKAVIWLIIFVVVGLIHASLSPLIKIISIPLAVWGKGKWKQYGINVWEGYDNSASADTGGDPDSSVSDRLGKARKTGSKGWGYVADKVDFVFEELANVKDHCNKSIEPDEGKKQVTTY